MVYNILASDNMIATYTFPAICVGFLYSHINNSKYNPISWILYLMVILTVVMLWSATSIVGVTLILVYIILVYKNNKLEGYINTNILILASIMIVIGFTFLGIQELFSFVIVDLLKKDITMTGRTNIWQIGLKGFYTEPILGLGYNVQTIDSGLIQILYRGGIISMTFLVTIFIIATKRIRFNWNLELDKFFSLIIALVLIMSISESWFFFFGFFVIINFSYNIHKMQESHINILKINKGGKSIKRNAVK